MNIIIYLYLILGFAYANLPIDFSNKELNTIDSTEFNNNINHLNAMLSPYGYNDIVLPSFNAGEVITNNKLNQIFNTYKNIGAEYNNVVFVNGAKIRSTDIAFNFSLIFNAAKSLIPNSCKSLLEKRPELLNQNAIYYIDLDGYDGSIPPAQVLCDMTTNQGGWTNIAANIGTFSNILVANINAANTSITNSGINVSSDATAIINGSLISQSSDSIGGCSGHIRYLKLTSQILNLLTPSQVKIKARSYGSGTYSCGGLLRYSDLSIPAITKITPSNFDSRTLGRCDENGTYPSTATSADLTFYTTFKTTDFSTPKAIGALEAQCGVGTGYIQYKEIWVR